MMQLPRDASVVESELVGALNLINDISKAASALEYKGKRRRLRSWHPSSSQTYGGSLLRGSIIA